MYHTKSTDKELVAPKSLNHVKEEVTTIKNTVTVAKQEMPM